MFDALNPSNDLAEAQAASPTAHLLDELALFGHRPYQDDPDPRPLPEPDEARRAMIGIFSTAQDLLCDTRLEDDLPEILWGFVNTFHRKLDWIELELDHNEVAQRRSQGEQDGSEVRSVELERRNAAPRTRSCFPRERASPSRAELNATITSASGTRSTRCA